VGVGIRVSIDVGVVVNVGVGVEVGVRVAVAVGGGVSVKDGVGVPPWVIGTSTRGLDENPPTRASAAPIDSATNTSGTNMAQVIQRDRDSFRMLFIVSHFIPGHDTASGQNCQMHQVSCALFQRPGLGEHLVPEHSILDSVPVSWYNLSWADG